ncbi:MAG: sensor histidine kinase [Butyrivibrio sp.]|nr:sensor histidine kinase [Butyrivibrio sp.]
MSKELWIFVLLIGLGVLLSIVVYQQIAFRTGIQRQLIKLSEKLREILDGDANGSIMVFTENRELKELAGQINRLLEAHQRTKADFYRTEMASRKMLSNISHDIKTPMTVVLGYLEIMRLNGSNTTEMIEKTERKAQSVMELINEFFTLAKLEAGDMDIELSRLDICEVCRENVLDFYELLSNNEFQVEVDIPDAPIYVQGNKDALQRILFNLISNAVRYGADGRFLGVRLREEEGLVFIDITDKGKGIEKAFVDHVFDRLFTMEDSRSRQVQGNGLGLTIAKNLALQMGGDVTLDSVPHSRTVFTVRLKKMAY